MGQASIEVEAWSPLPARNERQVLGEKHPATTPLAHPRFGGGWRASARRKGASFLRPTACGAGEGHEVARGGFADGTLPQEAIKMAPQYFQRAPPSFTIFHSPFTIFKRPPSTTTVVPLPHRWGRQVLRKHGSPSPGKQGEARLRRKKPPPLRLLAHPARGCGWRAPARRKGAATKMAPITIPIPLTSSKASPLPDGFPGTFSGSSYAWTLPAG